MGPIGRTDVGEQGNCWSDILEEGWDSAWERQARLQTRHEAGTGDAWARQEPLRGLQKEVSHDSLPLAKDLDTGLWILSPIFA